MDVLFYINNEKKPLTINELKQGRLIFEDDLIWHDGLNDWTDAKEIDFLREFIKKRPPISKKNKHFKDLIYISIRSFLIYLSFTLLVSISSAFYESYKYQSFMGKIIVAHDKNLKIKEAKEKKEEQYLLEKENNKNIYLNKIEHLKNEADNNFSNWEVELNKLTPDENEIKYYENVSDSLKALIDYYFSVIDNPTILKSDQDPFEKYSQKAWIQDPTVVKPIKYEVPMDEIYIMLDDGSYWSRWCSYTGDIYMNETVSYNSCNKFLFRPYYSIFSLSNLSEEEQKSTFLLVFNYILSGLVSNFPLLILIFFIYYLKKSKKK
jgi:hypothetical protein